MVTRIFHCADLHYCPKHLDWVDKAFGFAIDHAIVRGCTVAVIAGDSFDRSMGIHEPAFVAFIEQTVKLASAMPVIVLQGTYSHDRPGSLDVLKHIPTTHEIFVVDIPTVVTVAGASFYCLPSLNKADPKIMDGGVQEYLKGQMAACANIGKGFLADEKNNSVVLVTHGTVNGCRTESGYAMISPDWEFDEEMLFSSGADAVMLGHIHAHQDWKNGKQVIAYPGSIARLIYGDMTHKGFLIWDVYAGHAEYKFIEAPSRELIDIEFNSPPDMEELQQLADGVTDQTWVRIRWSVDQEAAHGIDKDAIRSLFANAGGVKLEGIINAVESVRAKGISRAATVEQKLAVYAKTTGDEDRVPGLVGRLEMLYSSDPEKIVDRIVRT